jgi:hypothetical protein
MAAASPSGGMARGDHVLRAERGRGGSVVGPRAACGGVGRATPARARVGRSGAAPAKPSPPPRPQPPAARAPPSAPRQPRPSCAHTSGYGRCANQAAGAGGRSEGASGRVRVCRGRGGSRSPGGARPARAHRSRRGTADRRAGARAPAKGGLAWRRARRASAPVRPSRAHKCNARPLVTWVRRDAFIGRACSWAGLASERTHWVGRRARVRPPPAARRGLPLAAPGGVRGRERLVATWRRRAAGARGHCAGAGRVGRRAAGGAENATINRGTGAGLARG